MIDYYFALPIGALLIFCLRIVDVSMSMIRMILAVRGLRGTAAMIGFFEVMIWLVAASHAMQHMNSVLHIVGYAAGFATGNYVGIWLEGRFALGVNNVRAVFTGASKSRGPVAAQALREAGYAVTEMPGRGREGEVDILNLVVPRKSVPTVVTLVRNHDPSAFVTVEEVRSTTGGYVGMNQMVRR